MRQFIDASFFAYIVGNVTTLVVSLDRRAHEFEERLDKVNEYMHSLHLPGRLQRRVRDYVRLVFSGGTECMLRTCGARRVRMDPLLHPSVGPRKVEFSFDRRHRLSKANKALLGRCTSPTGAPRFGHSPRDCRQLGPA